MERDASEVARLADGLWARLRDVVLVAERIESFAFGEGGDGPTRLTLEPGDAEAISRDLVLTALRAAGDAADHTILRLACAEDGVSVDDAAAVLGVPRLVASERVAALMQAGLVARQLDAARARATDAGAALVTLVDEVARDLGARLERARGGPPKDGLPLL